MAATVETEGLLTMLRLIRRRRRPASLPWTPHEQDRVWIKGSAAVHTVTFAYADRAQCMRIDHPDSRTDIPASWLRPVDPELHPRRVTQGARRWWR